LKIKALRNELLTPIQTVIGAVASKSSMTALEHILLRTNEQVTEFVATDLEVEIRASSEAVVSDVEGEITLPGKRLYDILRALPDQSEVTLTIDAGKAAVKSGRSRFALNTLQADLFPLSLDEEFLTTFTVPQSLLKHALDCTSFAMTHDKDPRMMIRGVLFDCLEREPFLRLVATNGHRLAACDLPGAEMHVEGEKQAILPKKGCAAIQKALEDNDNPVRVMIGKNHLRLVVGTTTITSKLITERFPDYLRVIPRQHPYSLSADREAFREVLHRVSLGLDKEAGIGLSIKEGKLRAFSLTEDTEDEFDLIDHSGDIEIGFSPFYLQDVLRVLEGDTVVCGFHGTTDSFLIQDASKEDQVHVVMSRRL
jgi:DNA polymerase-3 subunit beta